MSEKSHQLYSHAVVVFESLWPRLPEEAPKVVGEDGGALTATKQHGSQNDFSGYFKIIPLNVIRVSTTSAREGHTFKVDFDGSMVFIEAEPSSLSRSLARFLRENAFPVDGNINLMLGALEGVSRERLQTRVNSAVNSDDDTIAYEQYLMPGEVVSQLLSEMDTATIFLIQEHEELSEAEVMKIAGGSFSRINETEGSSTAKIVSDLGIPEFNFLEERNNIGRLVRNLRAFMSNLGLRAENRIAFGTLSTLFYGPDIDTERTSAYDTESKRLLDVESGEASIPTTLNQSFGPVFTQRVLTSDLTQLRAGLDWYYQGTGNYVANTSYLASWGFYETVVAQVDSFERSSRSVSVGISTLDKSSIVNTIIADVYLSRLMPQLYSDMAHNDHDIADESIRKGMDKVNAYVSSRSSASNPVSYEGYIEGLVALNRILGRLSELAKNERGEGSVVTVETDAQNIDLDALELEDVPIPASCQTPYLVLKGHISSIETTSSVSEDSYDRLISVHGEGLELPLKRSSIMFDNLNREFAVWKEYLKFRVSNSTPIEAALEILDNFAPDYVKLEEASEEEINEQVKATGSFGSYRDMSAVKLSLGNMVFEDATSDMDTIRFFTPLHYVSQAYLHAIKDIFDEVNIREKVAIAMSREVPEDTIYKVLGRLLQNSSLYSWFIDEFGYIRVRYENSAVAHTYSTILSPPIDDERLVSLKTRTSEGNVYTLADVVPQTMAWGSPSDSNVQIYGRSVPPSVAESEVLYETINFDLEEYNHVDVAQFFKDILTEFERCTIEMYRDLRDNTSLDLPPLSTVFNLRAEGDIVKALTLSAEVGEIDTSQFAQADVSRPSVQPIPATRERPPADLGTQLRDQMVSYRDRISEPDAQALVGVARNIGIDPRDLVAIIGFETGYSFSPAQESGASSAVGLIQFMPATAEDLGTSTDELKTMSFSEQLVYVEAFFRRIGVPQKATMFADWYMGVLWPIAIDKGMDHVLFRSGQTTYTANAGLDINNDGKITKREAATKVYEAYENIFGEKHPEDSGGATRAAFPTRETQADIQGEPNQTSTIPVGNVVEDIIEPRDPLASLYQRTNADRTNAIAYVATTGDYDIGTYDNDELFLFDLSPRFQLLNPGTGTSYYDYIADCLSKKAVASRADILGFTSQGSKELVRMAATMAALGIQPGDLTGALAPGGGDERGNVIKFLVENTRFYVNPKDLDIYGGEEGVPVINEHNSRSLPYKDLALQEQQPSNISPDLYRYGLRIMKTDDYYLSTIKFTSFRADTLRKLHEEPVRDAQVTVLGNPMYKVGNNVLVVTKNVEEHKYNYVNQGSLNTLKELGEGEREIVFRVDDLIADGLAPTFNYPWGGEATVTPDGVKKHFEDAYEFILGVSGGKAVPITAYVPLYGVYGLSGGVAGRIQEYLRLLVQINLPADLVDREAAKSFDKKLQGVLGDIVAASFGANPSYEGVNRLISALTPQFYHAYQYNIEKVSHSWGFGTSFETHLTLNYGLGAAACMIPSHADDFEATHPVGYLLNKSPYMLFNSNGKAFEKVAKDHPLYQFSLKQLTTDEEFFSSLGRYNVAKQLEKLRRQLLKGSIYKGIYRG